ncbi:MAG: cytochrome oxidase maturation protein, cbb3-type [Comamonas sp. SCN 65-56]|nr:cbb3-type cytochrome oxidase assembly protein CcoS [Comamonas sp. SCN 65-56]ODS92913.1 MAG: cytochrome oxidase maturation protein, cbb3-type [Comamonas sp. SCN 65-56]
MDILYLLIPLSVVLALLIVGALGWAIFRGQFEDLEREGERIFEQD